MNQRVINMPGLYERLTRLSQKLKDNETGKFYAK